MSRFSRLTVIQRKIETSYGTSPGSWATADSAMVYAEPTFRRELQTVESDLIKDYFGASEAMPGWEAGQIEYEIKLAGSGTAGTPPVWGTDILMCGFAETITAGSHVAYTPVSAAPPSATVRFATDGVIRRATGCRANGRFLLLAGDAPRMQVSARGVNTTVVENPTPNVNESLWPRSFVINERNSGAILFGCTYHAGTGAITGGTAYRNRGMEIDFGNRLEHMQMLPADAIDLVGRKVTATMTIFPTAAQEVAIEAMRFDGTMQSVGFKIGNTAGQRIGVFMGNVQITEVDTEDYQGRRALKCTMVAVPNNNGNNEIVVVAS